MACVTRGLRTRYRSTTPRAIAGSIRNGRSCSVGNHHKDVVGATVPFHTVVRPLADSHASSLVSSSPGLTLKCPGHCVTWKMSFFTPSSPLAFGTSLRTSSEKTPLPVFLAGAPGRSTIKTRVAAQYRLRGCDDLFSFRRFSVLFFSSQALSCAGFSFARGFSRLARYDVGELMPLSVTSTGTADLASRSVSLFDWPVPGLSWRLPRRVLPATHGALAPFPALLARLVGVSGRQSSHGTFRSCARQVFGVSTVRSTSLRVLALSGLAHVGGRNFTVVFCKQCMQPAP